ncbi:MAG: hypothetical protein Q9185_004317 [Variospora sp. 1 TL-2023]
MDTDGTRPFKVIVVGGGIAGLLMCHALHRAGTDHVLIEKRKHIVTREGASFGFWPHAARIVDQLGLWTKIRESCIPMKTSENRACDGTLLQRTQIFQDIGSRHGYDFLVIERQQFVKILYDNLPDAKRVVQGKSVNRVIHTSDSVRVILSDGSHEEGDILVGCDGVNSVIREQLWEYANGTIPSAVSANEKRSPTIAGMAVGNMTTVPNRGFSFMVTALPDQTYFFVNIKLAEPLEWPNKGRYTLEEAEKEAAKYASMPVTYSMLFGELWKRRIRGHLYPLEEGIFKLWHFNRTVLVGDCVHKVSELLCTSLTDLFLKFLSDDTNNGAWGLLYA